MFEVLGPSTLASIDDASLGAVRLGAGPALARALADFATALSCAAIAGTLAVLSRKARTPAAAKVALAGVVFLAFSAAFYLVDAVSPWMPLEHTSDLLRTAAAAASVAAAFVAPAILPRVTALVRGARLAYDRGRELEANRKEHEVTRRELAAAVARARELETQLVANVSHELRTPLALILGPTEKLLTGGALQPEQRAELEVVARNARTLLKHVGDLLHVAKNDAGKLSASYSDVDLGELCRATGAHFDGFAADRRIGYTVDAPPGLSAEVDAGKLQRALLNLLSNAFKFTPKGGLVRCSLHAPCAERVVIEVADSGPGVPPCDREAVFERFRQREGGATRRFGGTGLGLAIVKDFVEVMDGTVTIGEAPEGGALFRVELPTVAPPGATVCSPDDSAVMMRAMVQEALDDLAMGSSGPLTPRETEGISSPSERGGLRARAPSADGSERPLVLVVEDNTDMNRFVSATLAPEFRVVAALDGQRGLEKAIALRPDLVVSDVMMPGLSGDALLRELRARPELDGTPVVVLTAKTDDALRARLLREGAQDYLSKPFVAEELRARVRNLVSMKRARDILQRELGAQARDLESLAGEVAQRRRELTTALDSARVARDHADRASAMKTSFLRMVSHELRTPLTSLKLNLERLTRSREEPRSERSRRLRGALGSMRERQDEMIHKIAASAGRLHELIESLLEYARIEGGRLRVEVEDVDARALCQDVIDELLPQAEQKGLALRLAHVEPSAPITVAPPLRSDPRLLRLVIVNLVGNAVKFTQEGEVLVFVSHSRGAHRICVRDSGPGIPVEDHERIFEPFEQMEPVLHKHTRGVGLGLSIVKEMVEALSGRIELASELGAGSTFTVVLPPLVGGRVRAA
jgi:signal transduction histidine kinase